MSLISRIPRDFYKLFTSKYTEYYMAFLVAIYGAMEQSYSVLGLTEKACRAVMNEQIASEALLWDGRIMMKKACSSPGRIWHLSV